MVKRTGIAKGIEVVVSGKVRGQRAKAQKYKWGYLISTGQPKHDFIDEAVRHVHMRQGVLGIRVRIFVDTVDSSNKDASKVLPDNVTITEPKANPFKDVKMEAVGGQQQAASSTTKGGEDDDE